MARMMPGRSSGRSLATATGLGTELKGNSNMERIKHKADSV
jgi:hypothetical protein